MRWAAFGSALDGEAKRASMSNKPMTVLGQQGGITPHQRWTDFGHGKLNGMWS